jgi:hypothetical protein
MKDPIQGILDSQGLIQDLLRSPAFTTASRLQETMQKMQALGTLQFSMFATAIDQSISQLAAWNQLVDERTAAHAAGIAAAQLALGDQLSAGSAAAQAAAGIAAAAELAGGNQFVAQSAAAQLVTGFQLAGERAAASLSQLVGTSASQVAAYESWIQELVSSSSKTQLYATLGGLPALAFPQGFSEDYVGRLDESLLNLGEEAETEDPFAPFTQLIREKVGSLRRGEISPASEASRETAPGSHKRCGKS